MGQLRNSTAAATSVDAQSLALHVGPLPPGLIPSAVANLREATRQYIQHLELLSTIAGPAIAPAGSPPASPHFWATINITNLGLDTGGALPSQSPFAASVSRAGAQPRVFLSQAISAPISLLSNGPAGAVPKMTLNGIDIPATTYAASAAMQQEVLGVRSEFHIGPSDAQVQIVTTVGDYLTNIAQVVTRAYAEVINVLYDRLQATTVNSSNRWTVWKALRDCDPSMVSEFADAVKVLRAPTGIPLYLPPAPAHTLRDNCLDAIAGFISNLPVPEQF